MKFPRPLFLLTVLMIAAVAVTGSVSLALEDTRGPLPLGLKSTVDLPEKSRGAGSSGFDYFLVDPNCSGSCVVTDQLGNWSTRISYSEGTFTGAWGVDGRDYYFSLSGFTTNSGVMHYHNGQSVLEQFTRIGGGTYIEAVYDIWGFSTESIFCVGSQNWDAGTNLFEYADGAWTEVLDLPSSDAHLAVWGTSATDIFTVGLGGDILHYDGDSATPMASGSPFQLNDVWGTSSSNVYAVGMNGTVLHYDGQDWAQMSVPTNNQLNGIWGTGPDDIYVVGGNSTIMHWDGISWSLMTAPQTGLNLRAIHGSSSSEIVAVGIGGALITYDGTQWIDDTTYTGTNTFDAIWGGFRADGDQYWEVGIGVPEGSLDQFNGDIYQISEYLGATAVCGDFTMLGEDPMLHMAYLNGGQWEPLYASTGPNGSIHDLEVYDGQLICGGAFTEIDGTLINNVAAWNGTSWSQLGAGLAEYGGSGYIALGVWDLVVFEGDLYALGEPNCTAKWDGTNWTPLSYGGDEMAEIFAATVHGNSLYGVSLNGSDTSTGNLKVLFGNTFESVDPAFVGGFGYSILSKGENLYVGGLFEIPGLFPDDPTAKNLGIWNGSGWESSGADIDAYVLALKDHPDGVFVGGYYNFINGLPHNGCAIWDGAESWAPMGSGFIDGYIWDAEINGEDITVVGPFNGMGNKRPGRVAVWQPQTLGIPGPPEPTPAMPGEDYLFSINIAGEPGPYTPYVYYRKRDIDPFSGAMLVKNPAKDGVYEATIPGDFFGDLGFQYFVSTGSGTDPITYPANAFEAPAFMGVTLTGEALDVPVANQYIMMGVPFVPDKTINQIMTDALGAYDKSKWRFGRWDPQNSSYDEFPNVDAVAPGRGYWLIQKNPVAIPANGVTTSTVGNVVLTLEPGWNMIANPYNFPISWGTVIRGANVENRLVARSGGSYADVVVLNPWQGYWVRNNGLNPSTLTIRPIPLTKSDAGQTAPAPKSQTTWAISFAAEKGDRYDSGNVAGVSAQAEPGIDPQDLFEVPAMPGDVSLYFEMANEQGMQSLCRDLRPEGTEGQSWDMVLKVDGGGTVELVVEGGQQVPQQHDVVLIAEDRTYDLRETSDLRITVGSSGETRLRLAVGNPGFVEEQEQTLPRPYALRPAYPNPFNPQTTVSFTLPRAGQVNIDIFDVRGHLVRRLVDDSFEAGLHQVTWEGLDSKDRAVSAGVYFYRMRAGDFVQNQKMTLVK